jgi:pyruvate dehydrogenase E1 component alpha subunit
MAEEQISEVVPGIDERQAQEVRAELGDARLVALYKQMVLMRRFEEAAGRVYQMGGHIRGFCHLYIGQEAVAVGTMAALEERDYIVSGYREHGHALARGMSARSVMAELYGKATGCSGGKGGSMHLFDVEKHFMGGWGIVGGHVPTAAGLAFASKYRGDGGVCVVFLGDGAVPQGAVHETLNMVELWDLPLITIVENNRYAMGTAIERFSSITDLERKADGYGMIGDTVEGQNLFAVYARMKQAVADAREGKPCFLDVKTYRFRGHSMSDPGNYRTKEELQEEQQRDPVDRVGKWLVSHGILTDDQVKEIDKAAREESKDAMTFAEQSPLPDESALLADVYVDWQFDIE